MLFLRSFINLLIVPVLFLVLSNDVAERKNIFDLKPSFPLLVKYCVAVALNIPITRIFIYFSRFVKGIDIEPDSTYYTIFAILGTVLMAFVVRIYARLFAGNEETKN